MDDDKSPAEREGDEVEEYDKLVRDDIPEVIAENGDRPITHRATGQEYRRRLHEKLDEEVAEFHEDPSTEELADVLAVCEALRAAYGIEATTVEQTRREKADERGGFEEGVVLDAVFREDQPSMS